MNKDKKLLINNIAPLIVGITECLAIVLCSVLIPLFMSGRLSFSSTEQTTTAEETTVDSAATQVPPYVTNSTLTENGALKITEDVYLFDIGSESGSFIEDGNTTENADYMTAAIANIGDKNYQLIDFTVTIGGKEYNFSATTLFRRSMLVVQESACTPCPEDKTVTSVKANRVAEFQHTPSVHLEEFEIKYGDGIVSVKNLTETDYSDVYVYYKQTDDAGNLYGGITFRVNLGEIKAGESISGNSSHLKKDSTIVFVTYNEN